MKGWILYSKSQSEITNEDHAVIRMLAAAKAQNIDLRVVSPAEFELVVFKEERKSILWNGKPSDLPDFLIPRLGAHSTYFSLAIIRQLERNGVVVCNSAASIELVRDKLQMHQLLAFSNLPTPKTMLAKFPIDVAVVGKNIGFPVIVKNISGSQGRGIYLAETPDKFTDLMELIYSNNPKANIILQEFIDASYGRDIRLFVLGGRVIGGMTRISKEGFKANFSRGGRVEPVNITPDMEWLATETARLVNMDIVGVDLLFDKDGYKICEANSSPGFKGLEQIVGENVAEQIMTYVRFKVTGELDHSS